MGIAEIIIVYGAVGLLFSVIWSIASVLAFITVAGAGEALFSKMRDLKESGWLDWIPLLFGKGGK